MRKDADANPRHQEITLSDKINIVGIVVGMVRIIILASIIVTAQSAANADSSGGTPGASP